MTNINSLITPPTDRKALLLLGAVTAATMLATSCSDDSEILSVSGAAASAESTAITFSSSKAQTAVTRSGVTATSLENFYVTSLNDDGTPFFEREAFDYDATSAQFTSAVNHYWPTSGTLSFYAVNEEGTQGSDSNGKPSYTYTDWSGETDLLAATVVAGTKQMPYPLVFRHLTSQVTVTAEAADKSQNLTYKLVSISMSAPCSGTYRFADETAGCGSWTIDNSTAKEYSYDDAMPLYFEQDGTAQCSGTYWNILPVTDGTLHFDIEYHVLQNGKVIDDFTGENCKSCEVQSPELTAGNKYNYNFLLSLDTEDVITFTLDVADWEESTAALSLTPRDKYNGYEYVDLGLPSGLKWATMNVGATAPEEFGGFYSWGETEPHDPTDTSCFTYSSYKWKGPGYDVYNFPKYNSTDKLSTIELEDDAARQTMGANWRIPTRKEMAELINYTTQNKAYYLNGVKGCLLTSTKNGKTIFFPYSGYVTNNVNRTGYSVYISKGTAACLMTSTLNTSDASYAYQLFYYANFGYSNLTANSYIQRNAGASIRAVSE